MLVVRMLGVGKRLWVVRIIEVVRMEWGGRGIMGVLGIQGWRECVG